MASLRKRGESWYVRYRDEHDTQREVKAGPDRGMAKRIAGELEGRVRAIRAGVMDPHEKLWVEADRRPLPDHVHDWHANLIARGRGVLYANQARDIVLKVLDLAGISRISYLNVPGVERALHDLRSMPGRDGNARQSDATMRHHVTSIKMFSKWLHKSHRSRMHTLADLEMPELVTQRERRELGLAEAQRLILLTPNLGRSYNLSGPDRAALYAVAMNTGYRANELRHLTPEHMRLDANPPTISLEARWTKNRRKAEQPIPRELAEALRVWVKDRPPGRPLWAITEKCADMLRADLEAIGVKDARSYCFHSLRHSYVSGVVNAGVSLKEAQTLARHLDPRLTVNRYSHTTMTELGYAVEKLAHTLPTPCVSTGLTGSSQEPEKRLFSRPQSDPARHLCQIS